MRSISCGIAGACAEAGDGRVDLVHRPPELLAERPGRGEAQRRGGEAPAGLALAQEHEILLHQARGDLQRREPRRIQRHPAAGREDLDHLAAAPVDIGKALRQVFGEERQHFGLRRLRPRLGGEHLFGVRRAHPLLLAEEGRQVCVDVDPLGGVERFDPDLEEFRRAVIGGGDWCGHEAETTHRRGSFHSGHFSAFQSEPIHRRAVAFRAEQKFPRCCHAARIVPIAAPQARCKRAAGAARPGGRGSPPSRPSRGGLAGIGDLRP